MATFAVSALIFLGWGNINQGVIYFNPDTVDQSIVAKFNKVRSILKNEYYENVDENKLLEGAIAGMADSLGDPYTAYYTKEEWKMYSESITGSYVGIGVSISLGEDNLVTIVEPFEGSPAEEVGMKKGDKIIRVDGKDVRGVKDGDAVVNMIRGPENTKVKITVYRPSNGEMLEFDLARKKIKIANIKSRMLEDNIGYIRIVKFDSEINRYFNEHLNKLISNGMKALVIDVRDNPGGYYDQVVAICDRLLPEGTIVYTEDKYKRQDVKKSDAKELGMPIAVLINSNSASASEILAGAIKDHKKGTLVGTKTFGKGLVQASSTLDDGSGLKVTIARYFTPSGVCIHGAGIMPDIEIDVPEEYKDSPISDIPPEKDIQLKAAVENLKGKIK
ncbi:peptidase S41 [Clostridium thermosuccinogenes]|uniref:Peptidase S41 n=2 Tax=Clostridium thermosuccinogenes TaxID=84032 RepID=A0A2K2FHP2_9CLOT|nr:peptidase S41 [Pseudoclostridium thermosuccinogenes]PNT96551.1 peptidase S41 [Pseudoclostridium thermosuccinogenes]PNT98294.1 peptidase S41 [Pseudoclostridium thermosuccinogenes]